MSKAVNNEFTWFHILKLNKYKFFSVTFKLGFVLLMTFLRHFDGSLPKKEEKQEERCLAFLKKMLSN